MLKLESFLEVVDVLVEAVVGCSKCINFFFAVYDAEKV